MGTPFQVTIPKDENDIEEIKNRWMAESKKHGDFMRKVRQAIRELDKRERLQQVDTTTGPVEPETIH
jgi:hypothetical protein